MRSITRRDFLKIGAAGTALLAIESQLHPIAQAMEMMDGGRSVNRVSGLPRSFLPSTCTQCPAGCGIIGYVEESKLVKIGGNPKHLSNQSALCARGQAGINALYDPDRILTPLKRVGGRGENRWAKIKWDQAYEEVAKAMQPLKSQPGRFVYMTEDLGHDTLGKRFAYSFGSGNALGAASIFGGNKQVATQLTWGAAGDMPDVANTKYILVFGANPLESHPQFVGFARRLIEGVQDNQAKMVVFDVRLTNTSTRANEVYYVNPGTYAIVALAMANVIMQEGLHNAAFIDQWANISSGDIAAHLSQFTPEKAAAASGVDAAAIRRVATEFASTSPATTLSDGLVSVHGNGTQNERAVMLLNIITGNIDNRGGLCLPREFNLPDADPAPAVPAPTPLSNPADLPLASQQAIDRSWQLIRDRKHRVGVLMTRSYNPVYSDPDGGGVADLLKDDTMVPIHVAVSPFMTETAALADIVLPETTYLEGWDLEVRPSPELVPFISLRQPVVPPLKDARPFFEIATSLANTIKGGMEQYFGFKSVEDYLKGRIQNVGGLAAAGGLDYLKQHGVWFNPRSKPDYGSFGGGFSTPSGKLEVYSSVLKDKGFSPLPDYEPVPAFSSLSKDELVLTIFDTAIQTDAKTANCMWLDEILHNNPVWINPATAEQLGIKDGDKVRVVRAARTGQGISPVDDSQLNPRARSLETTAFLTEGIHPRVVAMANGVGHTGFGRIAQGEKISKDEESGALKNPNTELVWWREKDGIGTNPKTIVPAMADPVGGGQAWGDVVVTVGKIKE